MKLKEKLQIEANNADSLMVKDDHDPDNAFHRGFLAGFEKCRELAAQSTFENPKPWSYNDFINLGEEEVL